MMGEDDDYSHQQLDDVDSEYGSHAGGYHGNQQQCKDEDEYESESEHESDTYQSR